MRLFGHFIYFSFSGTAATGKMRENIGDPYIQSKPPCRSAYIQNVLLFYAKLKLERTLFTVENRERTSLVPETPHYARTTMRYFQILYIFCQAYQLRNPFRNIHLHQHYVKLCDPDLLHLDSCTDTQSR